MSLGGYSDGPTSGVVVSMLYMLLMKRTFLFLVYVQAYI
jgi:hypothetical protein